jgi:hypothetical protein
VVANANEVIQVTTAFYESVFKEIIQSGIDLSSLNSVKQVITPVMMNTLKE